MNRGELRQLVRDISRTNTQDVDDPVIDRYMDEGYAEIVTNQPWPWTYVTAPEQIVLAPGVGEYAVDSKVKRIVAIIEVEQRYPLRRVAQSDWARTQESIESTSRPLWFSFSRSTLFLWPVPATNDRLDVYYMEHPEWGPGDTEIPVFDEAFHNLLVDWGLMRLWEQEEDFDKSDSYRSKFEIKLNRMSRFYATEVNERPMIFGGGKAGAASPSSMPWLGDARLGGAT